MKSAAPGPRGRRVGRVRDLLVAIRLAGPWRWVYVAAAVVSLYLNVFVGVFQSFLKLPALNALAPTQSEPPFVVAQFVVLAIFVVLGIAAARSFHPETSAQALSAA